jgi:hypothetical protein
MAVLRRDIAEYSSGRASARAHAARTSHDAIYLRGVPRECCKLVVVPLDRQSDCRPQSALRTVSKDEIATVGASNVARNAQTQPDTARLKVPAFVQPMEGSESFLPFIFRYARTIVVHVDFGKA